MGKHAVGKQGEPDVRLSIVVAATHPWPEIGVCVEALYEQACAVNAEIIIVDRCGHGLPEDAATRFPAIRWLKRPNLSIYQLRAGGLQESRGEIVAITEDHCRPAPDWCRRILEAHAAHPDAAMVGGALENGSRETAVSWASYLLGNGGAMPPVESRYQDRTALQANTSYKRAFLPSDVPALGYMEFLHNRELARRGALLLADDRVVVEHVQPFSLRQACSAHYHAGRSVGGFRRERIGGAERLLRIGVCFSMPLLYWLRTGLTVGLKRRYLGWLVVSTPAMLVLTTCRSAGTLMGLLAGVGESTMLLR